MQNVACPITIVVSEKFTPVKVMNELSAIPVMIPGRASGRTKIKEIASRPKNLKRCTTNAAIDPRAMAMAVENRPARTDSHSAWRISSLCHVDENHLVDRPAIGQLCTLEELNAYTAISAIGTNRNSMISAAHTANATRLSRPVPITALRTLPILSLIHI